jgi:hypothetical protein
MSNASRVKAAAANKRLSTLLQEKSLNWREIKSIVQSHNSSTLDSLRRQALKRACLDPSICKATLKLLLQKTKVDHRQRVRYAILAVRCQNHSALTTLIYDDISVLYHDRDDLDSRSSGTLLHYVCEKHGWNKEVAFVLKETLENKDFSHCHEGMFECNQNLETPLTLSLQAGGDLEEIASHLREEYPIYFENNVFLLSKIVAEYCNDVTLYQTLSRDYPILLLESREKDGSTPLHYACFYQNQDMILMLLQEYRRREGRKVLRDRMLSVNDELMSPLGYLLLNVGDRDSQNVWSCIRICIDFFEELHVFHLMVGRMFDHLVSKSNCMRIVEQIINRLDIDLCALDQDGEAVVGILVMNMAQCKDKHKGAISRKILQHVLSYSRSDQNPAEIRDGQRRLPIHLACEVGLSWSLGLGSIIGSNIFALEEHDPLTNLMPFALAATNAKVDVNTVYEMIRCNPSVI